MSKDELLSALYTRGYRIVIQKRGNTQFVSFHNSIAIKGLHAAHCYSMEFTTKEIYYDVVWSLLRWSGLNVKSILDY